MTSRLELRQVSKIYGSGPSEAPRSKTRTLFRGGSWGGMGPSGSASATPYHRRTSRSEQRPGFGEHRLEMVSTSEQAKMRRGDRNTCSRLQHLPGLTAIENVTLPPSRCIHRDGTATGLETRRSSVRGPRDRYPTSCRAARSASRDRLAIVGRRGLRIATSRKDVDS